jgi:hypothetical protein
VPYAEGTNWSIEIVRHPISGGYQVFIDERYPPPGQLHTRVIGNKFGYARRETAERRAQQEADKRYDS